ncbi:DUF308 domain-containing protein [Candidatus Saccharibacteria bacterium]|nr:DUF308 domain-containing protein [Candidatus Saccharibacteria bacterium]MBR0242457.1 DUF308 domain-containing protein [Candidatus Saccharibacteria bacterium]
MPKMEIIKRPIERVGSDIKKAAWSSVIESLAILILGILFIAWPDMMVKIISYVVGIFFIVKGAFQIINYFVEKGQNDFFNNGLLMGVVSALIGIAALVMGEDIANIFRIVVGIFIIYESLVRINTAIKLNAAGIGIWKYILLLSVIILVLGVFVTFNDVTTVIGWMMIVSGLIGIIGDTLFIQQVNNVVDKLTK